MLFRLVRSHLGVYRAPLALLLLMQLISVLGMLYIPTLNASIINNGVLTGNTGYILRFGAFMVGVALVQFIGTAGAVYTGARTATSVGRDLRAAIFGQVQRFSAREVGQFGAASLVTRTTNDVQQVQLVVLLALTIMVSAPIMWVGGAIMALSQSVPLSSVLLVALPAMGVVFALAMWRMQPVFRRIQGRVDTINRVLREQITGVRVIRAFNRDEREQQRFTAVSGALKLDATKAGYQIALVFPALMLVVNVSSVAVLWFGGRLVGSGALNVGALTAFLSYLMLILGTTIMATFMLLMVPRAEVCAGRILEVLRTPSSVVPPASPVRTTALRGTVELRGAEFGYPGAEKPVLRDIDLTVLPGEVTAVIGSTGSGKTTLLNLIPRLYDVTGGSVLVDGADVRELDPARLTKAVGYVPQKPYLFSGTVASNLRYGRPDATEDELWHALEVAQAADFVAGLPDGLNSPIAQGGTNVSGGQRQRLAIACVLVRRPEIYLFDDSFSALDYATDAALRQALAQETADATVIIVAQRVSTIRHATRIIVLDRGRIVAAGSHSELMDSSQTYREIVFSQLTEQEAA